ncbi:hypothetical protein NC653_026551 [Populus alba x Populus x berolinensis]|uniref:Uncharacterized protein n=1 Tax=Populus alba x Populus x berolinensis TaxID=444605 RepID=A0AAD6MEC5_9ROSI|nr:hypothetical protein NC653_026551 [Populus alba x Populus x berolinensis]
MLPQEIITVFSGQEQEINGNSARTGTGGEDAGDDATGTFLSFKELCESQKAIIADQRRAKYQSRKIRYGMIFSQQARNSHEMDRVAPIAPSPSIINHAMPTQPPLVALVRGTLSPSTPNLVYSCQNHIAISSPNVTFHFEFSQLGKLTAREREGAIT